MSRFTIRIVSNYIDKGIGRIQVGYWKDLTNSICRIINSIRRFLKCCSFVVVVVSYNNFVACVWSRFIFCFPSFDSMCRHHNTTLGLHLIPWQRIGSYDVHRVTYEVFLDIKNCINIFRWIYIYIYIYIMRYFIQLDCQ